MSEFDNLKNEAEQYAQQHPQQVEEGEDAVEKKFGRGQQDQSAIGNSKMLTAAQYARPKITRPL